ncbi:MAG: hypothetical protein A2Z46_09315 [Nitrospirae bacterium RBG_19FT_COMBO_55_12]|nr:MAG: hypothetical protein A2Z46_09315 [Nitrospirae bacterium RBG_19FT_COMBO_55_12]
MLISLWKGKLSLRVSFWLFGIVLPAAYIAITRYATSLPEGWTVLTGLGLWLIYGVFISIAIWRSSSNYPGPKIWKYLARISMGIAWFIWMGMVLLFFYFVVLVPHDFFRTFSVKPAENIDTAAWETYRNEKYAYLVKYPKGWNMIEAKPRMKNQTENLGNTLNDEYGEIQRVTFADDRNVYGVGEFLIHVMSNPNKLSLEQWINKNYPETEGWGNITVRSNGTVDGKTAKRLSIAYADQEGIAILILYKGYIYGLSFAGENPNDTDVKRHQQIYQQILSTFKFIQ